MFAKFKRGIAAAALATLVMGATARAGSVTYYTEGFFGSDTPTLSSPGIYTDSTTSSTGGSGSSTLTFNGETNTVLIGSSGTTSAEMGNFTLYSTETNPIGDTFNISFTLELFQTNPSLGPSSPGTLVGSTTGNVIGSNPPTGTGTNVPLVVKFTGGTTFNVPAAPNTQFVYSVAASTTIQAGNENRETSLGGQVTQLPLPSTANAGLVALAGLASFSGLKKLRKGATPVTV